MPYGYMPKIFCIADQRLLARSAYFKIFSLPLSLQNSMNSALRSCTAIYFFMENERLGEYMKNIFQYMFAFYIHYYPI